MLAITEVTTLREAERIAGSLGHPEKMPGTAYGIPARACKIGSKLRTIAGSTCASCYALKGHYTSPTVQACQEKRLASLDDPRWENAMVYMLTKAALKVSVLCHRWHDSGDLQSVAHLARICRVSERTPQVRHWLPTREIGMVRAFLAMGGAIPTNLTIRASATKVDGAAPAAWPTTSTVHDKAPASGQACPSPSQGGKCGACRACWSRDVANVSYHIH
jgi:hypothetical protein